MDHKDFLAQLYNGSRMQRRRYKNDGLTDSLCDKIIEGNRNSLRMLKIRLFVLRFQNNVLWVHVKPVEAMMLDFAAAIERRDKNRIKVLMKAYNEKKNELQKLLKNQPIREASYIISIIIILTLTILLFREVKLVTYDKEVFSEKNRYNPLNPFFPLKTLKVLSTI